MTEQRYRVLTQNHFDFRGRILTNVVGETEDGGLVLAVLDKSSPDVLALAECHVPPETMTPAEPVLVVTAPVRVIAARARPCPKVPSSYEIWRKANEGHSAEAWR